MGINRRDFLAAGGALAATAFAPGRLLAAIERSTAARSAAPADLSTWPAVRAQFDLAPGWLHFSSFFLASHPRPVRQAIEHWRRALDDNPFLVVEHALLGTEQENLQLAVLKEIAPYLGSRADEIALVHNTTTGLALVYHGLPLNPGDEVLCTTHDHYVHHESIRLATARARATMRKIALYDRGADADAAEIVRRVRVAIRPRTRVLGVTWVHSSTGVRLPVAAIAQVVRDVNRGRNDSNRLHLVVDGVHGFGNSDVDVAKLGCDFFCAGTHKWLFAPRGTGIVWAPADRWPMMRPVIPDFSSMESFMSWMQGKAPPPVGAAQMSPGGFQAFEHQWGMRAAFEMHRRIGRARVAARIRDLNQRMKEGLAALRGVTLHTPRSAELSSGIVCFEVAGHTPAHVVERLLAKKIIASTSPYAPTYARLAAGLVNDTTEVDRAVDAVRTLARA